MPEPIRYGDPCDPGHEFDACPVQRADECQVGHHIVYYAQENVSVVPFAKAIMESGGTTSRATLYPTQPRHLIAFREFLIACGLEGAPEEQLLDRIRALSLRTILDASKVVWGKCDPRPNWPFQPVIDGPHALASSSWTAPLVASTGTADDNRDGPSVPGLPVIPDLPITSLRQGRFLRIPILTGYNADEGVVFVPAHANTNAQFRAFFAKLIPGLAVEDLEALEELYPDPVTKSNSPYRYGIPRNRGRQWARLSAAYGHYAYVCPVLQTAHYMSATEPDGGAGAGRVYLYRFAARQGSARVALHGDHAKWVAHDMKVLQRFPGKQAISDAMHRAWARFVASRDGDPNDADAGADDRSDHVGYAAAPTTESVAWPAYRSAFEKDDGTAAGGGKRAESSERRGRLMEFGAGYYEPGIDGSSKETKGTPAAVSNVPESDIEACRFWWSRTRLSEGTALGESDGAASRNPVPAEAG